MINENLNSSESFYNYLISSGYYFDKELIENYLLSLKVKPFVILTGNSGTGKTKLSQLFAEYYLAYKSFLKLSDFSQKNSNFVSITVTANESSWKDEDDDGHKRNPGWTLKEEDFKNFMSIEKILGEYEVQLGEFPHKASISFNTRLFYSRDCADFKEFFYNLYKETGGEGNVTLKISYDDILSCIRANFKHSDEINLKLKVPSIEKFKGRKGLTNKFLEYIPLQNADCTIYTNDFKYSAKAKFDFAFRIRYNHFKDVKEFYKSLDGEEYDLTIFGFKNKFPELIEIVPVGANWTENRNVIGYYNVLTKSYQHTQALDLLLKAINDNEPYFLILDEMNLSHVERYFSDFLSAMESGKSMPLHKANGEVKDVPTELKIPKNVFIVGTVNIDETTYMFSPKVLDRANVLEFKTFEKLSIHDYIKKEHRDVEFMGDVNYLENVLSDFNLSENILDIMYHEFANVKYEDVSQVIVNEGTDDEYMKHIPNEINVLDEIANELSQLNGYLKGSSFEFGYRTVNEILSFMFVAWKYEYKQPIWNNWRRYLDAQILQKILPKIHGSQMILGETLDNLLVFCLGIESIENLPNVIDINDDYNYPESAKKLMQMKDVLEKQRYVSFIN